MLEIPEFYHLSKSSIALMSEFINSDSSFSFYKSLFSFSCSSSYWS